MPERKNVSGRIDVAVVSDTALTADPFSYSKPCDTRLGFCIPDYPGQVEWNRCTWLFWFSLLPPRTPKVKGLCFQARKVGQGGDDGDSNHQRCLVARRHGEPNH
jgi:hypothetical protein